MARWPRQSAAPGDSLSLRVVDPRPLTDAALERCHHILCAAERERAARFRFERHRREYCAAHALLRHTLSRHAPDAAEPAAWRFETSPRGRPLLAERNGTPPPDLRFSISHTEGLVACAVARGREVGCDVERLFRELDTLALARRYFADAETRDLERRAGDDLRERFFQYWTLKEAYLKARGTGLQLPLASVRFDLDAGSRVRAQFAPELEDDPAHWQFTLVRPTPEHVLALALETRPSAPETVEVEYGLPECSPPGSPPD